MMDEDIITLAHLVLSLSLSLSLSRSLSLSLSLSMITITLAHLREVEGLPSEKALSCIDISMQRVCSVVYQILGIHLCVCVCARVEAHIRAVTHAHYSTLSRRNPPKP
jgi:hypothetical protein